MRPGCLFLLAIWHTMKYRYVFVINFVAMLAEYFTECFFPTTEENKTFAWSSNLLATIALVNAALSKFILNHWKKILDPRVKTCIVTFLVCSCTHVQAIKICFRYWDVYDFPDDPVTMSVLIQFIWGEDSYLAVLRSSSWYWYCCSVARSYIMRLKLVISFGIRLSQSVFRITAVNRKNWRPVGISSRVEG